MNNKKTSKNVSSLASEILKNPNSSKVQKQLSGSALSQTNSNKQTGEKMEKIASKVLNSSKYSDDTKTLAGSVLSQSGK